MAMTWKLKAVRSLPKLKNPILIEGLPGIGNVGKVAVDFMIDELGAKKYIDFLSYTMPYSVFVNEKNLVELPTIEVYHKKVNGHDLLFLTGDVHPEDEHCYEFCDMFLDFLDKHGCKDLVTLGGIGLQSVPKKPKIFCTGTSKKTVDQFTKGLSVKRDLYGVVGPIIGVSGLLIGLAENKKMNGVCVLAETFGHPMYLGIKGSKEILKVLEKRLHLKLDIKKMDKEIAELEKELLKRSHDLAEVSGKKKGHEETSYIG